MVALNSYSLATRCGSFRGSSTHKVLAKPAPVQFAGLFQEPGHVPAGLLMDISRDPDLTVCNQQAAWMQ